MGKRIAVVFSLFAFCMGLLCLNLISINANPKIAQTAVTKTSTGLLVGETRGSIYDYRGAPLVNETSELVALMKPTEEALNDAKSILFPKTQEKLTEDLKNGKVLKVSAHESVQTDNVKTVRAVNRYQNRGLAVHLIGYTNKDKQGVCGIEKAYDQLLSNAGGSLYARCSVNAKGKVLEGAPLLLDSRNYHSKAGVKLTLDKRIQRICEDALSAFGVEKGAVVVLDAKTAEIRAMASVPVFNQNAPGEALNRKDSPFLNRAITPYAVGSVFKSVVAAAALEQGIDESFSYTCTGAESVGQTIFHCHKREGHGTLNMDGAMANSCNPYFIKLFERTGKEAVVSMGENLGLGASIELADGFYTPSGNFPTADELRSPQDEANFSFGQGTLLASPLQMTALYAALANDGVYRAPSLMRAIVNADGEEEQRAFLPYPRCTMSKETAKRVQKLLIYTVENGSCHRAKPENSTAAGKSGTAQSGSRNEQNEEINHSWFCGWFPSEAPRYVMTVLKEDGEGGSTDCAPIFKSIAEQILTLESPKNASKEAVMP